MVILLPLLSGNVETSPAHYLTPADFKSTSGLGIIHLNVRSLPSKLDVVKIWINSNADIVVLSETWMTEYVHDRDICINDYNVYHTDRQRKGGGVAFYIEQNLGVKLVLSDSVIKELEL